MTGNYKNDQAIQENDEYNKLKKVIHEKVQDKIRPKVTEDYKFRMLKEPNIEVNPKMMIVENFYEGQLQRLQEMEKEKSNSKNSSNETCIENLQESFSIGKEEEILRKRTVIVASAGSGKTTLLRRMARRTIKQIENSANLKKGESCFKYIHYIEMKDMRFMQSIKPANFLFGGLYENQEDEEKAYDMFLKNQRELIIYFDGLDQVNWNLQERKSKINDFDKSDSETIMFNILSGTLLPHAKKVISSREFKVATLHPEARPEEAIELTGLSQKDTDDLFILFVGPEGQKALKKLKRISKRLCNLMRIPIYLVLTAIVMVQEPKKEPPRTATELFDRIVMIFCKIDVSRADEKRFFEIVEKMKRMAHEGISEGLVIFNKCHLENNKLTHDDVIDLMSMAPGDSGIVCCEVTPKDCIFFFCHQSLQEYFSASFISALTYYQFQDFVTNKLFKSNWAVVLGFVCGIIFRQNTGEGNIHKVGENTQLKKTLLQSRLVEEFSGRRGYELLDILAAIYESNFEDLINFCTKKIDLKNTPLDPYGADLLSVYMAKSKELEDVILAGCGIHDDHLNIMAENLEDGIVKIKTLNLCNNNFTVSGLNSLLKKLNLEVLHISVAAEQNLGENSPFLSKLHQVKLNENITITNIRGNITVEHEAFTGNFDSKERILEINITKEKSKFLHSQMPIKIQNFLQTRTMKFKECHMQYLELNDLKRMKQLRMEIPHMLLHCQDSIVSSANPSLIPAAIRQFKVEQLAVVMDSGFDFPEIDDLIHKLSKNGVLIYWRFKISMDDQMIEVIKKLQKNQTQLTRFKMHYRASAKIIVRLLEECPKLEKVSLAYVKQFEISESDKDKISEKAKKMETEIEFSLQEDEKRDAWYFCDFN